MAAKAGAPALPVRWQPPVNLLVTGLALGAALLLGAGAVVAPFLTLGALIVLTFSIVTALELAGGVALFTVLSFFERIPGTPETGVTSIKLAGGILGIAWLTMILRRHANVPFLARELPWLAYAVLAFGAWAGASMLWAEDVGVARSAALRLVQGGFLLFIVFSALRERRHVLWVLWAFVIGAVLSALIGLGGATAAEQVGSTETIRLAGGIGDPNELAAILLPALVIAVGLLPVSKSAPARLALGAAILILVLGLLWTQSRGGLVAMGVTAVIAPFLAGELRQRVIMVLLSIGAIAVTYFTLVAPPEQLERVTAFDAGGGTGRPDLWAVSYEMFRDHPVVGLGAGNFVIVEPRYATRDIDIKRPELIVDDPKGAHNTYLHTLTELGIVGMFLLGTVLVGCLTVCLRSARRLERAGDRDFGLLGRAVFIAVVGMLAAFTFISAAHSEQLWLLLGVAAAFATLARRAAEPDGVTTRAPR